jgi:hypothetical protein
MSIICAVYHILHPNNVKNITNIDRKLLEAVDAFVPLTEAFDIHLIDLVRRYYFVA